MVVGGLGAENIGEIEGIRRSRRRRWDNELELRSKDCVKGFLLRRRWNHGWKLEADQENLLGRL